MLDNLAQHLCLGAGSSRSIPSQNHSQPKITVNPRVLHHENAMPVSFVSASPCGLHYCDVRKVL